MLAVLLVAGIATVAQGAAVDLRFGPTQGGVINGNTITLGASDTATIEIWLTGLTNGFSSALVGLAVNPIPTPDWTFEAYIPGPAMYYDFDPGTTRPPPGAGDLPPAAHANGDALNDFEPFNIAFPYIETPGDVLLASIIIHCTGAPSQHTIGSDNNAGSAFIQGPVGGVPADYSGVNFADSLTIIQVVPEPASLALLGLGAFALIRRR
jgi:hypothetical protein